MKFSIGEGVKQLFRRGSRARQSRDPWREFTRAAEVFLWLYFVGVFVAGAAVFVRYAWLPLQEAVEAPAISSVDRSAYARVLEQVEERARAKAAAAILSVPDPFSSVRAETP